MKSLEELRALRDKARENLSVRDESGAEGKRVVIGMATCGIAAGARPVLNEFVQEVSRRKLHDVTVSQTGCIGICQFEPVVEVYIPGEEKVTYVKMTAEKVQQVITEHIVNGRPVGEFTIGNYQK